MKLSLWSSISFLPLALVVVAGCGGAGSSPEPIGEAAPPAPGWPPNNDDPFVDPNLPPCDPSITVKADGPALVVTDPQALQGFSLLRVLTQILERDGKSTMDAEQLLKRLFDTENDTASAVFPDNLHCDSASNSAFKNAPATDCPRAEGKLAKSDGLFKPGHPDFFAPVAVVNRFDLAQQGGSTCGEYRIVYAKTSGLTDPNDRLFLIFEGALANPSFSIAECRKIQAFWASLEQVEGDAAEMGKRLESFFFDGIPGFAPLVDPNHFGLMTNDDDPYGLQHGQVRLSQRMQDPWELREMRYRANGPGLAGPPFAFAPVTVKNNPLPELFDPSLQTDAAIAFRSELTNSNVFDLFKVGLTTMSMRVGNTFNAGESALSGPAQTNYPDYDIAGTQLDADLQDRIDAYGLNKGCPPGDPLTPSSIVRRATTQSCAGCHAPERFLGDDRKIGCGLVWPKANGEVHIDEHGALSPALTDVFLPRRASVVATLLQSCDWQAIYDNLQPGGFGAIPD